VLFVELLDEVILLVKLPYCSSCCLPGTESRRRARKARNETRSRQIPRRDARIPWDVFCLLCSCDAASSETRTNISRQRLTGRFLPLAQLAIIIAPATERTPTGTRRKLLGTAAMDRAH
jgi:hypothetical protein